MLIEMTPQRSKRQLGRRPAEVPATRQMRDLVAQKQTQFAEHLSATRALFDELAPLLIEQINSQPRETF